MPLPKWYSTEPPMRYDEGVASAVKGGALSKSSAIFVCNVGLLYCRLPSTETRCMDETKEAAFALPCRRVPPQ